MESATFGGGCFWCLEATFRQVLNEGSFESITPGFSGGKSAATYEEVCGGNTGHAEVISIFYDPTKISYKEKLLPLFWLSHDPTTKDRQGNDIGTQYRSVIFYNTEKQREEAEASKQDQEIILKKKITTEILKFDEFYPAEEYHHNYYKKNTGAPYCQSVIRPKLQKIQKSADN